MTACATAIDKLSERRNAVFLAQGSSLLQLHRSLSGDHLRDELTDELFTVAKRYSSPAISNIAMQIKSGGPFDKVKEMIENLITSLQGQVRETDAKTIEMHQILCFSHHYANNVFVKFRCLEDDPLLENADVNPSRSATPEDEKLAKNMF